VEATLRELMNPHKINLASLGNLVPHVHWHVIPRFEDDRNFPNAVWGKVARENPVERTFPGLAQALSKRLFHALA